MNKKPKLNISVDEAQQKIDLQLTRGKSIAKFTIRSVKDLETCESMRHEWYDFTKSLLESVDDNNELVNDFHYLTPTIAVAGKKSLNERAHGFRYHMKKDLENLQAIYNKLPLLQKEKNNGKKTAKKKPKKSISSIFDAHFFFVDIVGLSNWINSSTEAQIIKIETLNSLIKSCKTFKSATGNKKFILPTGDGMAIGFTTNIFTPLDLAIEGKFKIFNARVSVNGS